MLGRLAQCMAAALVASLLVGMSAAALAQERSVEIGTNGLSELDVASIEARLAAIEASETYDSVQKSVLSGLYAAAIEALNAAATDRARAAEFRELLSGSASELKALTQATNEVATQPKVPALNNMSTDTLRSELSSERSLLSSLRSQLLERDADLEILRNERPQVKLAAAEAELAKLESLTPATSGSQEVSTFEARSILQSARRIALRARINLLDQKRISYEIRQALASAAAALVRAKIERSEKIVAYLDAETLRRRNIRADDSLEQAERLAAGMGELPPALDAYLQENRALSGRLFELLANTTALAQANDAREADLSLLKKSYATLTEQLRVAGFNISPELAIALRKEREQLAQIVARHGAPGALLQQEIIDARLEQIQIDAVLSGSRDVAVKRLLDVELADKQQAERVEAFVEQLVADRYRIASDLLGAVGDYVAALGRSQSAISSLKIVFDKYRVLVDELLFWVPSAAVMGADNLQLLLSRASEELAPQKLLLMARKLISVVVENPVKSVAALLLLLALVGVKPRIVRLLERSGKYVGKVQHDRFRDTLWALLLTVLLSLRVPLLLLFGSALIAATGIYQPLDNGLHGAALVSFVLIFFHQLCRPGGLGASHFKWRESTLHRVRYHMRWYIALVVPLTVVTSATAERYGFLASDTLGTLAYVAVALATSVLLHAVFKPTPRALHQHGGEAEAVGSALAGGPAGDKAPLLTLLFYFFAVGLPILLAVLALNGFYYTSAQLQIRLFFTGTTVAAALVLFYLAVRLLAISGRRLRFKQILEERRVARERQDEQELAAQSGAAVPDAPLDMGQFDLDTVGAQTRSMARLVIVILCALVMWSIWSGLLPALGVFDELVLWQVNTGTDENVELKNITLQSIVIAFVTLGIIVLAMRNLPGLIDMIVLSRLDVEPGTNYAITSILNYFIIFTGMIFVFYQLGVQWSKLQWLVAALGVGLGFGLQEIVANFVSGLLILFERPIRVGDTVTIGGNVGTVTKIRIRATTVLDWDRKEQIIPNKTFVTEQLTNWTLSDPITRIIINVGVSYGSNVEQVHQLLTEVVNGHDRVLTNPPPSVFFTKFGESSLDFEARVFVSRVVDLMPLRHELNVAVFNKLKESGVEIPFPQRDLHLRSSDL